jgi:DNA-directed RNA polymerase subunit RPC12/RpoP
MNQREYRLHVVHDQMKAAESVFMARGWPDERQDDLYTCGSCSILFGTESVSAIRAGRPGRCSNCGAVNQREPGELMDAEPALRR